MGLDLTLEVRYTKNTGADHRRQQCWLLASNEHPRQTQAIVSVLISELELIQSHMAQKPVLRGEVGCACVAREVSVERGGMGERGCARRLGGWVWV